MTGTPAFVVNERAYAGPIPTKYFAGIFAEVASDVPLNQQRVAISRWDG